MNFFKYLRQLLDLFIIDIYCIFFNKVLDKGYQKVSKRRNKKGAVSGFFLPNFPSFLGSWTIRTFHKLT